MKKQIADLSRFFTHGEEPVFSAPWEAHAFALTVKLHERGLFSWSQWSQYLGEAIESNSKSSDAQYYENWLQALENLLTDNGIVDSQEYLRGVRRLQEESNNSNH